MGLIKERQYAKAGSTLQIYSDLVALDIQSNFIPKVVPPALDTYILKAVSGAPANAT